MKNAFEKAISSDRVSSLDVNRQARLWLGNLRDNTDYAASLVEIIPLFSAEAPQSTPSHNEEILDLGSFHHETCNGALGKDMEEYDIRPRLGEIKVPTLVVVGRHDFLAPVSYSEEISSGISGAKLVIFGTYGTCL